MRRGYPIALALSLGVAACGPSTALYTTIGNEPGVERPSSDPRTRCEQEEAGFDTGAFELDAATCAALWAPPIEAGDD